MVRNQLPEVKWQAIGEPKPKVEFQIELLEPYPRRYRETNQYCPECGEQEVLADDGADYYLDCGYICIACCASGHLWEGGVDEGSRAEANQIRDILLAKLRRQAIENRDDKKGGG